MAARQSFAERYLRYLAYDSLRRQFDLDDDDSEYETTSEDSDDDYYTVPPLLNDEGRAEPTEDYPQQYEAFVGNLPDSMGSESLRLLLNRNLSQGCTVIVKETIRPFLRGRPFAFARCNSEQAFNELLGCRISIEGRNLRFAKSRRIPQGQGASSVEAPKSPKKAANAPPSRDESYRTLRKAAEEELVSLEKEFKAKFDSVQEALETLRVDKAEKVEEKSSLEEKLSSIQTRLTRCDSEIASMSAEITQTESNFSKFSQDHFAKVDAVRERINNLRHGEEVNGNDKRGKDTLASLPDNIRDDLDCIICYETMGVNGAEIYQCNEGHLICPQCHQRVQQCPLCRKPYPNPGIRCRMAEALAASFVQNS